jgi:hypothetical protein
MTKRKSTRRFDARKSAIVACAVEVNFVNAPRTFGVEFRYHL